MHFGFNNQFIKVTRTWPKFQKQVQKNILFGFNIWNYEFICKTYSRYSKGSSFIDIRTVRLYPIR